MSRFVYVVCKDGVQLYFCISTRETEYESLSVSEYESISAAARVSEDQKNSIRASEQEHLHDKLPGTPVSTLATTLLLQFVQQILTESDRNLYLIEKS